MYDSHLLTTSLILTGLCLLIVSTIAIVTFRKSPVAAFSGPAPVFVPPRTDAFVPQQNPSLFQQLWQNMPWFRTLHQTSQKKFMNRVQQFEQARIFEGRNGLPVTPLMRLLISAEACRLTFGLQKFLLPDFDRILIYPDSFYSRSGKTRHNGEVNINGIIAFSWKHFLSGIQQGNDAVNLGLHEFTHALRFQGVRGGEKDPFFAMYYPKFRAVALRHMQQLRNKKVLRQYGFTNDEEFLAVCAEHFFEAPAELHRHAPELYLQLCILFNQDPLNGYSEAHHLRTARLNPPADSGNVLIRGCETDKQRFLVNQIVPVLLVAGFIYAMSWNPGLILLLIPAILIGAFFTYGSHGRISDIVFCSNGIRFQLRKMFSHTPVSLPYAAITKLSYTESWPEEDESKPALAAVFDTNGQELRNYDAHYKRYYGNVEFSAITTEGLQEFTGTLGYLRPEHVTTLIQLLRKQDIWVRVQLQ